LPKSKRLLDPVRAYDTDASKYIDRWLMLGPMNWNSLMAHLETLRPSATGDVEPELQTIAHQAGNTMKSFEAAVIGSADALIVDVVLSNNKVPVVSHVGPRWFTPTSSV